MSSNDTWSDRRGLFQRGKEVHEPGAKSAGAGIVDAVRRASIGSNTSDSATRTQTTDSSTSTAANRRRSSGVAFENLTNLKRGSQDYGERRASHSEMHGTGGYVSGWFNKTFRGMGSAPQSQPTQPKQEPKPEAKRGVMEWYEHRTDSI